MRLYFVMMAVLCFMSNIANAQSAGEIIEYEFDSSGVLRPHSVPAKLYEQLNLIDTSKAIAPMRADTSVGAIGSTNAQSNAQDTVYEQDNEPFDSVSYQVYLEQNRNKRIIPPEESDTTSCPPILSLFYENNISGGSANSMFGINIEFFLSKYFSFNYSVSAGKYNTWDVTRATPGIEIAGLFLKNTEEEREINKEEGNSEAIISNYVVAGLLALIPQGFNIYAPITGTTTLGFTLNPLNMYYFDKEAVLGFNFDLKLRFDFEKSKTSIIPYFGVTNIPDKDKTSFHFGLMLGFRL